MLLLIKMFLKYTYKYYGINQKTKYHNSDIPITNGKKKLFRFFVLTLVRGYVV